MEVLLRVNLPKCSSLHCKSSFEICEHRIFSERKREFVCCEWILWMMEIGVARRLRGPQCCETIKDDPLVSAIAFVFPSFHLFCVCWRSGTIHCECCSFEWRLEAARLVVPGADVLLSLTLTRRSSNILPEFTFHIPQWNFSTNRMNCYRSFDSETEFKYPNEIIRRRDKRMSVLCKSWRKNNGGSVINIGAHFVLRYFIHFESICSSFNAAVMISFVWMANVEKLQIREIFWMWFGGPLHLITGEILTQARDFRGCLLPPWTVVEHSERINSIEIVPNE